jgi:2-polyprenyl-3-methyl-5-hydroxy-6-metoxy-1,4-benzoquinol methylase
MRGVIEHLPDPLSELHRVHRILRKGGLLTINTPNIGSICGKLYGEKFRLVCPTHHIYYFSTKTLSLMLEKAGFKVVKVSYHYFDTPYASWKDGFKIVRDIAGLGLWRNPKVVSPAFYGNIVDIYVTK